MEDTVCALSTPPGVGAIAIVRLSGTEAVAIGDKVFIPSLAQKRLHTLPANKVVYGAVCDKDEALDDVLVTVFRAPHSFTGEDTVEFACHGSVYIQQELLQILIRHGARLAQPGEFTQRAFLNGKMDLSRAEAVADLIASSSAGMHRLAINQMRGGFAHELAQLRAQLLDFTSLIELELDFSDEEVEFADRTQLLSLAENIHTQIARLTDSFAVGNAIKNGIPVAIIGKPNTGKSTLLNALLNEERAIVSEIPGTTRDTIEETLYIGGQLFRFIDTAGIRQHTNDHIEALGIQRTFEKVEKAAIILYLFDLTADDDTDDLLATGRWLQSLQKPFLMLGTKNDLVHRSPVNPFRREQGDALKGDSVLPIHISCKNPTDIERVKSIIQGLTQISAFDSNDVIVTNIRHYEALSKALSATTRIIEGLKDNLSGDFLSQDIRECTHHLGEITGEITTTDILENIFSKFCIGK